MESIGRADYESLKMPTNIVQVPNRSLLENQTLASDAPISKFVPLLLKALIQATSKTSAAVCDTCREDFESRNRLHKHLGDTGHATLKSR
ncbi:uncharacterized protein LOC130776887 isoform X2 [Actinidia eriantha]|uniref:uncharacterized protein LOC130776887 isoform X2 n=1 Tax=Actinidia eriantha TaxID=165200 RepID=UPI0025878538|nr:uncharacterized protein LOC130776887 isoform X2 [Actinidia eriantha]